MALKKRIQKPPRQDKPDSIFHALVLLFLSLNVVRVAAWLLPDMFLFGMDFYKPLPLYLSVFFIAAGVALLIPSAATAIGSIMMSAGRSAYAAAAHIRRRLFLAGLSAAAAVFYFLRVKPYLGDGVSRVQDLGKAYVISLHDYIEYRGFQVLSFGLYNQTSLLLEKLDIEPYQTFYVYNVIAGLIFVYFVFRLIGELVANPERNPAAALFLILQPYLILFMGYIEYYALPLAGAAAYSYYAVRCLAHGSSPWRPAFILLIMISLHLLSVILIPSFFYLLIRRYARESIFHRLAEYRHPVILALMLASAGLLALLFRPGPLNALLIDVHGLFKFYNYAPFFLFHTAEVLNLLLLGAGTAIFVLVYFGRHYIRTIGQDAVINFFFINSLSGLFLLLLFNPSGSLAADWDIMTIPLFMMNGLAVLVLFRYGMDLHTAAKSGLLFSQTILLFAIWFYVNHDDAAAAFRIASIQNHSKPEGNPGLPVYADGMTFKYYYFIEKDHEKSAEIAGILVNHVNDESLWEYVPLLREMKAIGLANQFTEKYISFKEEEMSRKPPEWTDYFNLGRNGYMSMGQFEKAIPMFQKALELNPGKYDLHYILGRCYADCNMFSEAVSEYAVFDSMYSEESTLKGVGYLAFLENAYKLFAAHGKYDEGIEFFQRYREKKGDLYDYFIGFLYIGKKDNARGMEFFYKFLASGHERDSAMNLNLAQGFLIGGDYQTSWEMAQEFPMPDDEIWNGVMEDLKTTEWYKTEVER